LGLAASSAGASTKPPAKAAAKPRAAKKASPQPK